MMKSREERIVKTEKWLTEKWETEKWLTEKWLTEKWGSYFPFPTPHFSVSHFSVSHFSVRSIFFAVHAIAIAVAANITTPTPSWVQLGNERLAAPDST